jgi:hypothetical protein
MNNTSNLGAARSTSRGRAIRKVALPAATAAGSIVVALGTGVPAFLGELNLGNHNETLLSAADGTEPRGHHGRLRRAASVLVLSGSVAVGAVALGVGDGPTDLVAVPGNYCSSSGGGGRHCQPRPTYESVVR